MKVDWRTLDLTADRPKDGSMARRSARRLRQKEGYEIPSWPFPKPSLIARDYSHLNRERDISSGQFAKQEIKNQRNRWLDVIKGDR